jgi:DNA repair protein RecO (recombination protein O)
VAGDLTPAWVLHRRPYGDNGCLLELFTLGMGRVSAVARGIRRKARGGAINGLAQPFTPLLVALSGRGELHNLRQIEAAGAASTLLGQRLFSGLYVNELMLRLIPRFDPMPDLFAMYSQVIATLPGGEVEGVLRPFELQLLMDIGYNLAIDCDCFGERLQAEQSYVLDPDRGLIAAQAGSAENLVLGRDLNQLSRQRSSGDGLDDQSRRLLKKLTRQALAHRLGPRPLRSRALARAFVAVEKPQLARSSIALCVPSSGDIEC